jgi:uncharacterized protein (DUF1501 family)
MPLPSWFTRRADENLSRRAGLKLGTASILGLSLPECLATAGAKAAAKNVLVIYEQGGLFHMNEWDPKPEAFVDTAARSSPSTLALQGCGLLNS